MSLSVFKGDEANADYENDFFREFASNLVQVFEQEDLDGILIGHPRVPANSKLKPDCVLITRSRLVLVDFKNHGGKLWLPSAELFEDAVWRHDNTIVDGGNSINPFMQLKKQREMVEKLIGVGQYGKGGIACVVCFQQDMKIMNEVPGKYQRWFSVTNRYHYLNRIRDVIGIKENENINIEEIASNFEAKPYHDYYLASLEDVEMVSKANERLAIAEAKEAEADNKVLELEKKIAEAESAKKSVEKLKNELSEARASALEAKKAAEKEKQEFDDKKYALELETQQAIRAHEEASRARAESSKAWHELEREELKTKSKKIFAIVLIIIFGIAAACAIGLYVAEQNRIARLEAERLEQLEEDYKNGRECIPVERVADFVNSKNVCVDFYANYINDSKYYVFIDNAKYGTFALMISKDLISKSDANAKYLNKHLQARGSITKHEDTYEIEVKDLSQISIVQDTN